MPPINWFRRKAIAEDLHIDVLNDVICSLSLLHVTIPGFRADKLLQIGTMLNAARDLGKIDSFFPVNSEVVDLFGYTAWLTRIPDPTSQCLPDGPLTVAIDSSVWDSIQHGLVSRAARGRFLAELLGILSHEIAHVVRHHIKPTTRFVTSTLRPISPIALGDEWEAWLYAGFLRAFVFAEIGGSRIPDIVPHII